MSISGLVEQYFRSISKPAGHNNKLIDMVESLNPPKIDVNVDLKKEFYEDAALPVISPEVFLKEMTY